MKMHSPTPILKQKRTWIVAGVVIAVALTGLWVAASMQQAASVKAQVDEDYEQARAAGRVVLADNTTSQSERLAAVETLSNISAKSCGGEWWSSWQQALPSVQAATKDCEAKVKRVQAVSKAANELKNYVNDDTKVAKTFEVLKTSAGSGDWQKVALSSAESARRDIEAMAVTKDNKKLLVTSKDKLVAIIAAWTALNDASSKEDKDAYLKAQDELSQAYADLGAISDVSDAQIVILVAPLEAAIAKL